MYRDEVHVNQHMLAVISNPRLLLRIRHHSSGIADDLAFRGAPVLLNVENGDYVTLGERDCRCALEKVGLSLHLHQIRSFEKFTSEGMNYFYGDLFEILEKTFPSEFGGGPGDYQLVEEEDGNGQTRLTLVVHPEGRGVGRWKSPCPASRRSFERFARQSLHDRALASRGDLQSAEESSARERSGKDHAAAHQALNHAQGPALGHLGKL